MMRLRKRKRTICHLADMGQTGLPPVDPATGLPFGSEEDAIAF